MYLSFYKYATRLTVPRRIEQKKESLGDKIFHHHKHHEGEGKGSEQAGSDGKEHHEGKGHDGHKKESLLHRYEDYSAKENVKEDSDDIWGHRPHN